MKAKLILVLFLVSPYFASADFADGFRAALQAAKAKASGILPFTRYSVPSRDPIVFLTIREDTLSEMFLMSIIKRRIAGDRDLNTPGFKQIYGGGRELEIRTGADFMWEFPPKTGSGSHQGIRVYVQAKKWIPTPGGRSGKYGDLEQDHADAQKKKLVCTVTSENDDQSSNIKSYAFFLLFGGHQRLAASVRVVNVEGCVDANGNALNCEVDVNKAKPLDEIWKLWSNPPPIPTSNPAKRRRVCRAQ